MNRRSFLKALGSTAAVTVVRGPNDAAETVQRTTGKEVKPSPKRMLGKTGESISIIGYGGLALSGEDQSVANNSVSMAIDRGVNYFDVAPEYADAEEKMGTALQGKRNKIFLSCKTGRRDKKGAEFELHRSLKRLKTDHFDLYQLHHLRKEEELEQALGPNGAVEGFVEARNKGQVRFLGFSAHTTRAALLAMEKFQFDTVMFPVNFMECLKTGFGPAVVAKAAEKGMGVIAIKAMYRGLWPPGAKRPAQKWWYQPVTDRTELDLALRFTLSQPAVATAITPSDVELIRAAIDIAPGYRPLTNVEREKLRELSKGLISHFEKEEGSVALHEEWGEAMVVV